MTDRLAVAEFVEVRLDGVGGNGEVLVQEAEEVCGIAVCAAVLHGEELDAVTGGEDEGFADSGLLGEGAGGIGEAGCRDGETLADLDGRGGVIDSDQNQRSFAVARRLDFGGIGRRDDGEALLLVRLSHGVDNLWVRFAIQTTSNATRTAPER